MSINFEHYKVFYYVARNGSITGAAEQLYISQPAVSKCIKHLEKDLGCSLFYRNQRGMRLTPEGETLFKHVSKGWDEFMMGEKKIRDMQHQEGGVIRIATSELLGRYLLLPHLEKFRQIYPKVRIQIKNYVTRETIAAVREDAVEIGIVASPFELRGEMNVWQLCELQDVFIAGQQFRNQLDKRIVTLKELSEYPIVCTDKNTSTRHFLDHFFVQRGFLNEPAMEVGGLESVIHYVQHGMGIGIVPIQLLQENNEQEKIFQIHTDEHIPERQVHLIVRQKGYLSQNAQILIKMLTEDQKVVGHAIG